MFDGLATLKASKLAASVTTKEAYDQSIAFNAALANEAEIVKNTLEGR
jgi:hypothetical protein